jgi:ribulose-phosphate 3-epimerase
MSRPARELQAEPPVIAPSMLKCDFGNLQREVELLEQAGARLLHLDVMDGHFVPNLSYGPMVIERMRERTDLVFDAHLMISDPGRYLDDYLDAGCDWITVHVEAVPEPLPLLERIRAAGRLAGIALNPKTPVETLRPCVGACDLVLVMSVEPGFGGQPFIPGSAERAAALREMFGSKVLLSIDGGIGPENIREVASAGVDVFVAGSSIFNHSSYAQAMEQMAQLARVGRETDSLSQHT